MSDGVITLLAMNSCIGLLLQITLNIILNINVLNCTKSVTSKCMLCKTMGLCIRVTVRFEITSLTHLCHIIRQCNFGKYIFPIHLHSRPMPITNTVKHSGI